MADPIPMDLPPRDPRRELEVRLQNAPMQHAEALLSGYELLQILHENGTLDILRGLMGSKDKIIEQAVDGANSPAAIRMLRNSAVLLSALGDLDPEALQAMTSSWSQALTEAREKACDPPGLLKILRQFRSKDLQRALALLNTFLQKFGGNLRSQKEQKQ